MSKVIGFVAGFIIFVLLLLALPSHSALPAPPKQFVITGVVYKVHDGDTVYVKDTDGVRHAIRLAQIDAPELAMPYGIQSRDYLKELVLNKQVAITGTGYDKHKRAIGTVFLVDPSTKKMEVNLEMVITGSAWVYTAFSNDILYRMAEDQARFNKHGIWKTSNPQAPWLYRAAMKVQPTCGVKTVCSQMDSCAEAKQYFNCGLITLDANKDGIPCQSLCK